MTLARLKLAALELAGTTRGGRQLAREAVILRKAWQLRAAARDAGWQPSELAPPSQLRAELRRSRRGTTCHVIASGWSAAGSLAAIQHDTESVYTFNLGGVSGIPADVYVIEIAQKFGERRRRFSQLQASVVNRLREKHPSIVISKNIWEAKLERDEVDASYASPVLVIRDVMIGDVRPDLDPAEEIVRSILAERDDVVLQYATTAITCVIFAFWAGFEKIVVHGFDGAGPSFFSEGEWDIDPEHLCSLREFYPPLPKDNPHVAGKLGIRLLSAMRDELEKRDVELFCGNATSPAAKSLPIWRAD